MLSKPQQGSTGQPNPLESCAANIHSCGPESAFVQTLRAGFRECRFVPEKGLLLCISGGSDSVALLHGVLQLFPESRGKTVVAHVNHGLRAAESDSDAAFVEQLAKQHQLPFELRSIRPDEPGRPQDAAGGGRAGVEEQARKLRYEFFKEVAVEHDLQFVATAHHREDQAETVLHHIIRGSGIRGLAGIQPVRPFVGSTLLIRPLLDAGKDEILNYLTASDLPYRDDRTNTDVAFTRNRIRHELLPLLQQQFNSQAASQLISLSRQAGDTLNCLDELAERILAESLLEQQPDAVRLDQRQLAAWPLQLIRHTLTLLWTRQHWPRKRMTFDHWDRTATAAMSASSFAQDLPGGISVQVQRNVVRCFRRS
jgi:tRNA(Ile)-lysidine synthase